MNIIILKLELQVTLWQSNIKVIISYLKITVDSLVHSKQKAAFDSIAGNKLKIKIINNRKL